MWTSGMEATVVPYVAGGPTVDARRELQHLVADALERGERDVVVDLSGAEYVDAGVLGALVMLARRARAQGGGLRLANVNDEIRTVLALTKLDTLLTIGTGAGATECAA